MGRFEHDVFVSHAREDKTEFAGAACNGTPQNGVKVWFDSFTLKVGDRPAAIRSSVACPIPNMVW